MKKLIALLITFICLILLCLGYIGQVIYEYHKSDSEYESLHDNYVSEEQEENIIQTPYESPIPYRDVDIDGLLSANPDFVCWIYYNDVRIDYPVVREREDDINGYLHRTFEGQPNNAGCVFIPYDASDDFSDSNTFFYGHNMKNGSMFGSLKKIFRNPDENLTDPYFYVWTKDKEAIMYRVISMYVVDKDSSYFAIPHGDKAFDSYLADILKAGSIEGFIPFDDGEMQAMEDRNPIATLSVCYGRAGTRNRLLVHGVEIYREKYERRSE